MVALNSHVFSSGSMFLLVEGATLLFTSENESGIVHTSLITLNTLWLCFNLFQDTWSKLDLNLLSDACCQYSADRILSSLCVVLKFIISTL